jgi:hypothetical protein
MTAGWVRTCRRAGSSRGLAPVWGAAIPGVFVAYGPPETTAQPRSASVAASSAATCLRGAPALSGRNFASPADFNARLAHWLAIANTRPRRALGCGVAERVTAESCALYAVVR